MVRAALRRQGVPFVFITIACGAVSGFHALVSSGTTPKILANEGDVRSWATAAWRSNRSSPSWPSSPPRCWTRRVFRDQHRCRHRWGRARCRSTYDHGLGLPVTVEQMQRLATEMGESTLFARTGGAPSLAVGMRAFSARPSAQPAEPVVSLCHHVRSGSLLTTWMREPASAVSCCRTFSATSGSPWAHVLVSVGVDCECAGRRRLGLFLYIGVIDPTGESTSSGRSLALPTSAGRDCALRCHRHHHQVRQGALRIRDLVPLVWLALITSTAAWQN